MRADHPRDIKRGGVCTYYKEHLPLICKPNLTPLDECLVCELKIGNKKCFITVLYRSPSQSLEEFERFKNGWVNTILNINNSNPFLAIFLGDFNARNTLWWNGDIINSEGLDINELSSHYNLHQLINTPTHILPNSESCINWHHALKRLNVNDQVEHLSSCILNVFSNFVPNKTITCRDKDPPWMTEEVKKLCYMKTKIYENYVKNGRTDADKDELVRITSLISDTITKAKEKYLQSLGNKLNDPQTGAKSYWSILNKLLQKIKIPLIPPILFNGTFITNVNEKITLFNTFFAEQCTPINNSSTLPPFEYKVNSKIEDVSFSELKIVSIIRSLNSNKAHGWDGISIRMIKICDETVALPLKIIFDTALKSGCYPDKWKRANVVPVHKKESKNILKNYRPISLLPVCRKFFEKCIYNSLYSYLEYNDIIQISIRFS